MFTVRKKTERGTEWSVYIYSRRYGPN